MAEFFEQICAILAETGRKHPGDLADSPAMREFFSASVPAKIPAPAVKIPAAENTVSPAAGKVLPPPVKKVSASLEELACSLRDCRRCPLAAGRTNMVFGKGNPHARLMFIGEGPGFEEDQSGIPFVGKAGQLLDKMIAAMQFSLDEVYIANVVKCRPPGNRTPMPEEIEKCAPFLKQQIDIIRPEVIVALGAVTARTLLNTTTGISRLRGKWCSYENIPVMPTFHPAFLLRQESAKKEAWQDLQLVMARFGKVHKRKN